MLEVADVPTTGREDFDEPETITGDVIVSSGVLLGIGYKECAADVLNIEWREAVGDFLGFERLFSKAHALEVGGIDEVREFAGRNQKIRGAAIENDACGSRLGSRRRTIRRRNGDVASAVNENGPARAVVESGGTGIVVGNPPGAAARGASQSPRVFQIGVWRVRGRNRGPIRNEVRLFVMLRRCENREQ